MLAGAKRYFKSLEHTMSRANQRPTAQVLDQEQFRFVKKQEISRLTGLSDSTLKRYRLAGVLIEEIHWIRLNSRSIRYNAKLILDWLQNINDRQAHSRAIEAYLGTLASNTQKVRRSSVQNKQNL